MKISDIAEREGRIGQMLVVSTETTYKDQAGKTVCHHARRTAIRSDYRRRGFKPARPRRHTMAQPTFAKSRKATRSPPHPELRLPAAGPLGRRLRRLLPDPLRQGLRAGAPASGPHHPRRAQERPPRPHAPRVGRRERPVRRVACQYRGMDMIDKDVICKGVITAKRPKTARTSSTSKSGLRTRTARRRRPARQP